MEQPHGNANGHSHEPEPEPERGPQWAPVAWSPRVPDSNAATKEALLDLLIANKQLTALLGQYQEQLNAQAAEMSAENARLTALVEELKNRLAVPTAGMLGDELGDELVTT